MIITDAAYFIEYPDSLVVFYDVNGDIIRACRIVLYLFDLNDNRDHTGKKKTRYLARYLDPDTKGLLKPRKICIGPFKRSYGNPLEWVYFYDKNDNIIANYYHGKVPSMHEIISRAHSAIDWDWVNNNENKVEFKL